MIRRLFAALIACAFVAIALLVWRLSQGPVSLAFVTPYLEEALRGASGDWRLDVETVVLMSDLKVHARGVSLLDNQGTPLLSVPDLVVRPSFEALMHGFAGVGGIEISGAEASLVRRVDGSFGVAVAGAPEPPPPSGDSNQKLVEDFLRPASTDNAIGFLHRVRIIGARLNVEDLQSGTSMSIEDADIGLVRSVEGQKLTLHASLVAAKDPAARTAIEAELDLQPNGDGFALTGEAKVKEVDVGRLGLYWPQNAGAAARGWVTKNITKGRVPEVVLGLALDSDSGAAFRVTRLDGNFRYEGLEVRWSDDSPPVSALVGSATFDKGSMHFKIDSGESGGIKIRGAKVDLLGLDIDKERLELSLNGAGPFTAALRLFPDAKVPLETEGDTTLDVNVALPLRAKLRFDDVDLKVDANPKGLKVRHAAGSAVVGSGQLRYQKRVKAVGNLAVDLTDVRDGKLDSGGLHWTQPPGTPCLVGFKLQPTAQPLKFDSLNVSCEGLQARGSVVIADGGKSGSADLRDLHYAKSNLERLEGRWAPTATTIHIGKGSLDLQPLLKEASNDHTASSGGKPADLDLSVDGGLRLQLDRNSWMENVKATFVRRDGEFQNIDLSADLPRKLWSAGQSAAGDTTKSFWLRLQPSGPGRRLDAGAPDFGALLKAVDASNAIRGGTLVISGRGDKMKDGDVMRAHVKVTDFVIAEAPLAVRILSVAALDKFVSTLRGDGLQFDSLKGTVIARGDQYELSDFRAYGSSVGWTAAGLVDIATDEMSIDGSVIPAYTANQVLKNIPILGTLFVGADKSGLIAISYKVRGPFKDPKVSANPLTALTPGYLRRVWELGD